ncbi:putative efflux pump antibiotic resistance protein [Phaeoacremonium minimum UCRPA7]|uniref:Putative efflux pump antibiotic resistance protein n=1 Tax=Phaeoacremonium minimum (strain UCR-PA7) TaxID=1286976 RepID=R8BQE1_PHAM7|nr:putative efflux pump antibiotic resistance protein [Phaeoacremonium minimum UCRPA7]EOO01544.1 putative efflux pump antibiotic resistance protein [Phaeoacremonium minimum UCRPA7]
MQLGGTALTLALAGCVFQNVGFNLLKDAIGNSGFSDEEIRQALAGVDSRVWDEADADVMTVAVEAVTKVIARLFYIVLAAGAMAFLCGCLMPWRKLDFGKAPVKGSDTEAEPEEK